MTCSLLRSTLCAGKKTGSQSSYRSRQRERPWFVGAGKAAAAMAKAVEDHYKGKIEAGIVVDALSTWSAAQDNRSH